MLEVGETKTGKALGYASRGIRIYAPCAICGEPRWVTRRDVERLCPVCAAKKRCDAQVVRRFPEREYKRGSELGKKSFGRDLVYWKDTCPICGKDTWKTPRYFGTACSATCAGVLRSEKYRGKNSPVWKGGRQIYKSGYAVVVLQPDNPFYTMTTSNSRVFEHRLVMAQSLGRCLETWEVVHHKNGIRQDNRLENLELLPNNAGNIKAAEVAEQKASLEKEVRLLKWQNKQLLKQLRHGNAELAEPEGSGKCRDFTPRIRFADEDKVHTFTKVRDLIGHSLHNCQFAHHQPHHGDDYR